MPKKTKKLSDVRIVRCNCGGAISCCNAVEPRDCCRGTINNFIVIENSENPNVIINSHNVVRPNRSNTNLISRFLSWISTKLLRRWYIQTILKCTKQFCILDQNESGFKQDFIFIYVFYSCYFTLWKSLLSGNWWTGNHFIFVKYDKNKSMRHLAY